MSSREVQADGRQHRYIEDEQFNLDIKMIPDIVFVTEDAVEEAFENMTDHISTNTQPIR